MLQNLSDILVRHDLGGKIAEHEYSYVAFVVPSERSVIRTQKGKLLISTIVQ